MASNLYCSIGRVAPCWRSRARANTTLAPFGFRIATKSFARAPLLQHGFLTFPDLSLLTPERMSFCLGGKVCGSASASCQNLCLFHSLFNIQYLCFLFNFFTFTQNTAKSKSLPSTSNSFHFLYQQSSVMGILILHLQHLKLPTSKQTYKRILSTSKL